MKLTDKLTRLANRLTGFVNSKAALSMLLAFQILIVKTSRAKPSVIAVHAVIAIGGLIGIHTGSCPVKYVLTCICAW